MGTMEKSTTDVSIVLISEKGENAKMEKRKYSIDDLFKSLELKEFDTMIFAPREEEHIVNGRGKMVTVGTNLKEKVRAALPSTEPDFVKGLIEEAAAKYQSFSRMSAPTNPGWEKRVIVGYLTSIGAEELAKSTRTEYFEVPSGLDLVGIAAEGLPDEKATLAARKNLATLGLEDEDFTIFRDVRIKSDKFGSLCGSGSSHLLLEGEMAGYGVFENALDGFGCFGTVGEYAGRRSIKSSIYVREDAGSGFMSDSTEGRGDIDGNVLGSSAGSGSENLMLTVKGYSGDLFLAESKEPLARVGETGDYSCYNAQRPCLIVAGKAGKSLGEKMTEGEIFVKEIDTYQKAGKLLGHSGTGMIRVPDEKSRELLAKENKPGYTIEVDGKFFTGRDGDGCESCSCGSGACAKE